jgi:hypothetical protein
MDILHACCAGLDVHQQTVVVTVRRRQQKGTARQETRTYGTMTGQPFGVGRLAGSRGRDAPGELPRGPRERASLIHDHQCAGVLHVLLTQVVKTWLLRMGWVSG